MERIDEVSNLREEVYQLNEVAKAWQSTAIRLQAKYDIAIKYLRRIKEFGDHSATTAERALQEIEAIHGPILPPMKDLIANDHEGVPV